MIKVTKNFDHITIQLASAEVIRSWSYGEVKKPETLNYRTLKPEKEGLFCEKIFGTTKEWECYCGKFKSIRYKNVVCDRCGVEVTHPRVRRERMGHIELAAPVSHIWYYRSVPSRIGLILDLTLNQLHSVLYYEKYIVIDPGTTDLKKMQILNEEEYIQYQERYGSDFIAGIGAESIKTLLEQIDLDKLVVELKQKMLKKGTKVAPRTLKRIEILEQFRNSNSLPQWMIMTAIPVIPPDLRPMVQLDGGRFATSDLNDLYRRTINRNNRLKRLLALGAPDIIIRNEKRMLQESVDALFDNSRKKKVVKGSSSRLLKSLSDVLRGKQGRFRQNLLGKRVDYSGRSVIVVGPKLKLYQCGLPVQMALELFKPFIVSKLIEREVVFNIKRAKFLIESEADEIWPILDEVIKQYPVLLNRAPTLHRLGIQAFEVVLVEGKSIHLHPLVCRAYNADFDGDQMAVHVPLGQAAQIECWMLMLSAQNLLDPASGQAIVLPSHDIVIGLNYLTLIRNKAKGEGSYFASTMDMLMALEHKQIEYGTRITIKLDKGLFETTPGRVIVNELFPEYIPYLNEVLSDKKIKEFIEGIYRKCSISVVVSVLDALKEMGFYYATRLGISMGMNDIVVPEQKKEFIDRANNAVEAVRQQYLAGIITGEERYNRIISVWSKTSDELTDVMMDKFREDQNGFNHIFLMAESGARGSKNQIRQLAGMRGLMARPSGDIIELPVRSNFKEGLSVIEFFISTNGARKGLADTALKTADAGYLTRRLVDIAQDVVINEEDCGTISGIYMSAIKRGEEVVETLRNRIEGLFSLEPVRHPISDDMIVDTNEEITEEIALAIENAHIEKVFVRTVFTCESQRGVCRKCYGRNLATLRVVDIGEAVGIVAAQSIGQPGTQLTMRTFHVGGVASTGMEENYVKFSFDTWISRIQVFNVLNQKKERVATKKGKIYYHAVFRQLDLNEDIHLRVKDGDKLVQGMVFADHQGEELHVEKAAIVKILDKKLLLMGQEQMSDVRNGSILYVEEGSLVLADQAILEFDLFSEPIIAENKGKVRFVDLVEGVTYRDDINVETGLKEKRVEETITGSLDPAIHIVDTEGKVLDVYILSGGAYVNVANDDEVLPGDILAKVSKESEKTQDITGGLPRVGELFEARIPKNISVLSQINGIVHLCAIKKNQRQIDVEDEYGQRFTHYIPVSKRLLVRNGDYVLAGEKLCDGNMNPHDILYILGEHALQFFLLNEIQEVYRRQGVNINDKHIGIVIKQMVQKVQIVEMGDTNFIYGQQMDRMEFKRQNLKILKEGGVPAVAQPLLLGVTKASLNIKSFISAASFQETTKILTNAAIMNATDPLYGLKENVVVGQMIPAGTGMGIYREIHNEHSDVRHFVQD